MISIQFFSHFNEFKTFLYFGSNNQYTHKIAQIPSCTLGSRKLLVTNRSFLSYPIPQFQSEKR